jgi:SSS family solute:Na+ symporter
MPAPLLAVLQVADRGIIFGVGVGFLLTLLCVGLVFRRFSHDSRDYFCAGGQATWWLVGGSFFMQSFSAWTFTGGAGAAYHAGWGMLVMFCGGVINNLFLALAPAVWFRQLRVTTPADVIRLRFGAGMEQFYSGLQSFMGVAFSGVQLYSLAIFTATLLGLDINLVIVVLGVVVLFYTAMSGAWAVLAADFIKALILMPVSILVAVVCLKEVGGMGGLMQRIADAGLSAAYAPVKSFETVATLPGVTPGYFVAGFFLAWYLNGVVNTSGLANSQKFLAVKDGREARRAALFAAALALIGATLFFIPPMTARLLIPTEVAAMPLRAPAEGAYAAIVMHLLPAGLVGLVLVGMCAATMSSLDGGLTGLAGLITQNIYPAICRQLGRVPLEGRARLILARVINFSCAVIVIACALGLARFGSGGVFKLLLDLIALVLAPVAVPLFWGLFIGRTPQWAAPVSIIIGIVASAAIAFGPSVLGTTPWYFQEQIFTVVGTGTLVFLGSRLFYRGDNPVTVARDVEFFSRRNRRIDFAAEVGAGNDTAQLRIVGVFGLVLGAAMLLLLFPASSAGHFGKILSLAAAMAGTGALLFVLSGKRNRPPS